MKVREITKYEHFVSFVLEDEGGDRVHIQYRSDHVWQDEYGAWHIRDKQRPSHVARLPSTLHDDLKLSPAMWRAIEEAAKCV